MPSLISIDDPSGVRLYANTAARQWVGSPPSFISVIEPEDTVRQLLNSTLVSEGHFVSSFAGVHGALVHGRHERPNIVILNLTLPLIPADSVITTLRVLWGFDLPIIALNNARSSEEHSLDQYGGRPAPFGRGSPRSGSGRSSSA